MELMHNDVIRIAAGELKGLYRVVLDEPAIERVVAVRMDSDAEVVRPKGGRKKTERTKNLRRKAPLPLIGELLWLSRGELESLDRQHHLLRVEIELDPVFFLPITSDADRDNFVTRKTVMMDFLSLSKLREGILVHRDLGGLVNTIVESGNASRSLVYKL